MTDPQTVSLGHRDAVDDTSLSLDELLACIFDVPDTTCRLVRVPQWGGVRLEVRSMDGASKADYQREISRDGEVAWQAIAPALLRACVYRPAFDLAKEWSPGASTVKVFDGIADDKINGRNAGALELLTQAAAKLSGIGAPDEDAVEDVPTVTAGDGEDAAFADH